MIWHNVRLMNVLTAFLLLVASGMLIASGVYAFIHLPKFSVRSLKIETSTHQPLQHLTSAEVLAHLNGHVPNNFFTADLNQIQQIFMAMPWVRNASIRRHWPNALSVEIEEYVPFAIWGTRNGLRLVDQAGAVFSIRANDLERLPKKQMIVMNGPEGSATEMVERCAQLERVFLPLGWHLSELNLSQRYAWMARFDNGLYVELGREEGENHEDNKLSLEERAQRFVASWPKLIDRFTQITYADLRYPNGFAVHASKTSGG